MARNLKKLCLLGQKYTGTWGVNTTVVRPRKNVLVLVIGRVDFDANKKKCQSSTIDTVPDH